MSGDDVQRRIPTGDHDAATAGETAPAQGAQRAPAEGTAPAAAGPVAGFETEAQRETAPGAEAGPEMAPEADPAEHGLIVDGTPEPWRMVAAWGLLTLTGSIYLVGIDVNGQWWMGARNTPNPGSCRLPDGELWRIVKPTPWPPRIGRPIALLALPEYRRGEAGRVPGGGKITSAVVDVLPVVLPGDA